MRLAPRGKIQNHAKPLYRLVANQTNSTTPIRIKAAEGGEGSAHNNNHVKTQFSHDPKNHQASLEPLLLLLLLLLLLSPRYSDRHQHARSRKLALICLQFHPRPVHRLLRGPVADVLIHPPQRLLPVHRHGRARLRPPQPPGSPHSSHPTRPEGVCFRLQDKKAD
jgi:hypothetical protein